MYHIQQNSFSTTVKTWNEVLEFVNHQGVFDKTEVEPNHWYFRKQDNLGLIEVEFKDE